MYAVSADFINQTKQYTQSWYVRGTIGNEAFTGGNILAGSMHVSNRCSEGADITIGAVHTGELTCTFMGLPIPRTGYQNKDISIEFGLRIGNRIEWIPFGVYQIAEAQHSAEGVEVIAYDNMRKLDKVLRLTDMPASTPMQLLAYISQSCDIDLGINSLTGFVNADKYIKLANESDIETYRDLLYWLCQTICGFATMDRQGRLVVRRFVSQSVDSLSRTRFKDSVFADYSTRYTGVSYVNTKEGTTRYFSGVSDDGTTINLGSNPFINHDEGLITDILLEIQRIQYIPFTTHIIGGAHYDLGDVITHTDGIAGESSVCCVMSYDYNFHHQYEMVGIGANPLLATAKSKTDKNVAGLLNRMNTDEFVVHHYVNTVDIVIHDGYSQAVIEIAYAAKKDTTISLSAELQLVVECVEDASEGIYDAEVTVTYTNNGENLDCEPVETYMDGSHILHLIQKIPVVGNTLGNLTVSLSIAGGNLTIPVGTGKAWLEGTGLVAEEQWDGILHVSDWWTAVGLAADIASQGYADAFRQSSYVPVGDSIVDIMQELSLLDDLIGQEYTESVEEELENG